MKDFENEIRGAVDSVTLSDEASARIMSGIRKKAEKKRPAPLRIIIPAAAVLLAVSAVFVGSALRGRNLPGTDTANTAAVSTDDGGSGQGSSVILKKVAVTKTGEKLDDAELSAYIEANLPSIRSALAASGVNVDGMRIADHGYCHVSCNGETAVINEGWRDCVVQNDKGVAAIITFVKENGVIYYSSAFGAAWFADYTEFLRGHAGEKLLYMYVGEAEAVIAPDGTYFSASGPLDRSFENVQPVYATFYDEAAVYVP